MQFLWVVVAILVAGVPCGTIAGTVPTPSLPVIANVHPNSGLAFTSPAFLILPDGSYLAFHDLGPWDEEAQAHFVQGTFVHKSTDKGKSWKQIAVIGGMAWGSPFVVGSSVYLLGTRGKFSDIVIRRSNDGGQSWTEATDAESGLLASGIYGTGPTTIAKAKGRIWRAFESGSKHKFADLHSFILSAPENADLLKASNWTRSASFTAPPDLLGPNLDVFEGNAVATSAGDVRIILRTRYGDQKIYGDPDDKALMLTVSNDGHDLNFDRKSGVIVLPGAHVKFMIRYDARSQKYWSLTNYVPERFRRPDRRPEDVRNTLALVSSSDLRDWRVNRIVWQSEDIDHEAFHYVDWSIEGDDLVGIGRACLPQDDGVKARTSETADYILFLRVSNFRKPAAE